MMKKLSLLISLMISLTAIAQHTGQWPYALINNTRGTAYNGIWAKYEMFPPIADTNWTPPMVGAITIRPQDTAAHTGNIYSWSGAKWNKLNSVALALDTGYFNSQAVLTQGRNKQIDDSIKLVNNTAFALRMLYTDTASMLIPYRHWLAGYLTSSTGIPLSGTTTGHPVTGDIEVTEYFDNGNVYYKSGSQLYALRLGANGIELYANEGDGVAFASLVLSAGSLQLTANRPYFKGPSASSYFGANYDDNTYTQKRYVDSAYKAYTDSVKLTIAGGGITALTGDVTASGTGSVAATIASGAVTDAKVATGIDAAKLADGSVSNAELQYIGTLSSNAQTQIAGKEPSLGNPSTNGYVLASTTGGVRSWVAQSGGGVTWADFIVNETPTGSINSSNTAFTIANTPVTGKVVVYLNGLKQKLGTDYTISGTALTMLFAPVTGDDLSLTYPK